MLESLPIILIDCFVSARAEIHPRYYLCGGVTRAKDKEFGGFAFEARQSRTVTPGAKGEVSYTLEHDWADGTLSKEGPVIRILQYGYYNTDTIIQIL